MSYSRCYHSRAVDQDSPSHVTWLKATEAMDYEVPIPSKSIEPVTDTVPVSVVEPTQYEVPISSNPSYTDHVFVSSNPYQLMTVSTTVSLK